MNEVDPMSKCLKYFLFVFLLAIFFSFSCRNKKEAVITQYSPVFNQTEKSYARTPDRSVAQLDTLVLIFSNLLKEIVRWEKSYPVASEFNFLEVELLIDVSVLNEKPLRYDTSLVLRDYLYRREWAELQFPERNDTAFVVSDPFAFGSDLSEQFRDRDIFNKPFLRQREIMMFQNRDFSKADSVFAEANLTAPNDIGDTIPYQESINLLYNKGNLCLLFDTVYIPYREPIEQFPLNKLISKKKYSTIYYDTLFHSDLIEFRVYDPSKKDVRVPMVRVQGGTFKMGSNEFDEDERPATEISISSFLIGKYEITNELFCFFLNTVRNDYDSGVEPDGSIDGISLINLDDRYTQIYFVKDSLKFFPKSGYENHPVVNVTWNGAQGFAKFAMPIEEKKNHLEAGRLPSEAEWEYAAHGGVFAKKQLIGQDKSDYEYVYRFAGGNYLGELGYFVDNSNGYYHPVGAMRPNELGIHDMCGNVWEWCSDRYDPDFLKTLSRSRDPINFTGKLTHRVVKGGSWSNDAMYCRITNRNSLAMEGYNPYVGFRLWKKW